MDGPALHLSALLKKKVLGNRRVKKGEGMVEGDEKDQEKKKKVNGRRGDLRERVDVVQEGRLEIVLERK